MDTHQVLNCDAFEAVCVDFLCLWFEKGQKIIGISIIKNTIFWVQKIYNSQIETSVESKNSVV